MKVDIAIVSKSARDELPVHGGSNLPSIIRIFFNFAYYLGASPFRFVRRGVDNEYYFKKTWKPQQVVCAFLHILSIFQLVAEIRKSVTGNTTTDMSSPKLYIDTFRTFCNLMFKVVTIKRMWFNSHDYLKIINVILAQRSVHAKSIWYCRPTPLHIFYGFYTVKVILRLLVYSYLVLPISTWTFSSWLHQLAQQSCSMFGFNIIPALADSPIFQDSPVVYIPLAILMLLSQYIRYVFSEFCDVWVLACGVTLWTSANSFSKHISNCLRIDEYVNTVSKQDLSFKVLRRHILPHMDTEYRVREKINGSGHIWNTIYSNYQAVQNLSRVVNTALGSQALWFLCVGLAYYSIYLNVIFTGGNLNERFNKVAFFVLAIAVLYTAADICIQVENVKLWLTHKENVKSIPSDEVNLVLHELIFKDIGIRGNNIFTITFPFLGGYLSLMVTFFIIAL